MVVTKVYRCRRIGFHCSRDCDVRARVNIRRRLQPTRGRDARRIQLVKRSDDSYVTALRDVPQML